MLQFIIRRFLKAFATMFLVLTVVFFFTRLTGNPFERESLMGNLNPEMLQELQAYYGFDKPVWAQYVNYLDGLMRGYAGRSVHRVGQLVTEAYGHALIKTGKLAIWCIPLGLIVGIPLGIVGALKKDKAIGQAAMAAAFVGYAFPSFIIAIGVILIFSYILGWLPSMGDATAAHYILPILTLSASQIASIARFTRSSMLDRILTGLHQDGSRQGPAQTNCHLQARSSQCPHPGGHHLWNTGGFLAHRFDDRGNHLFLAGIRILADHVRATAGLRSRAVRRPDHRRDCCDKQSSCGYRLQFDRSPHTVGGVGA